MQRWLIPSVALVAIVVIALGAVLLLSDDGQTSADHTPTEASPPSTASPDTTATPSSSASVPAGDELLLRLTDVPPGNMVGDDSGCGQITPEGADPPLDQYIAGEFPKFCVRQMEYVCGERAEDIPLVITSGVVFLSSEQKAVEGMDVASSMARWLLGTPAATPRPENIDVGDEALLFEVEGINQTSGLLIVWRNAAALNLIEVIEPPPDQALLMIEALAQLQNGRFTDPQEPEETDTDDTQVPLNCDDSDVPVYWVGETFSEDGLPEAQLARSYGPGPPGSGPGMEYMLDYDGAPATKGFTISIWTSEQWQAFLQSELGPTATSRPCTLPHVIELDDRTIEIHSPTEGCAFQYMAHVLLADAIVTVNVPFGLCCAGPPPSGPGAFDTPAALEAIARALEER